MTENTGNHLETATFGAGCFWGVEETFRQVPGVKDTAAGYAGGTTVNPTYEQVCSHTTGHAEVVQVTYDPAEVSYEQLLEVFWRSHDPTRKDRHAWDAPSQYRSAIFVDTPEQERIARQSKEEQERSARFEKPIVTEIEPAPVFYRAEEYHQQYVARRTVGTGRR